HVVDVYPWSLGERQSQTLRRLYIQGAREDEKQKSGGAAAGAGNAAGAANPVAGEALVKLSQLFQAKQYSELLQYCNSLPENIQHERMVMFFRLHAATRSKDPSAVQLLDEYRKRFPNEASGDLVSIDPLLQAGKYEEAMNAIDRLDKIVGGDPYLDTVRAATMSKAGKM